MAMDNGYADGSIVVDTTIDSSGFRAGSDKLKRAVDSLAASFDKIGPKVQTALDGDTASMKSLEREAVKLEDQIKKSQAEMEKLGHTKFSTADFEKISKDVEKANKQLLDLYTKRDKLEALGVDKQSRSWRALIYDIKAAEDNLERLEKTQAHMKEAGSAYEMGFNAEKYSEMSATLNELTAKLADVKQKIAEAEQKAQEAEARRKAEAEAAKAEAEAAKERHREETEAQREEERAAREAAREEERAAARAQARMEDMQRTIRHGLIKGLLMIGKTGFASFTLLAKGAKSAATHIKSIVFHSKAGQNSIKALSKTLTGFFTKLKSRIYRKLITSVYSGITQGIKNLVVELPELNASISAIVSSLGYLKNSSATAFAPLINVVAPALSKAIDLLGDLFTHIGMVVSALTGATSFKQAVKVQKDYAASLTETSKAAESAKKSLAGFDRLNNTTTSSDSSSSSSSETLFKDVPITSGIADFAKKIRNAFLQGNYAEIGKTVASKINGIFTKINQVITKATPKIQKGVDGVIDTFNALVDNVDWNLIGDTVGKGFNIVINALHSVVTRFDFGNLGEKLATGINGLITRIDWNRLGETIGGGLKSMFDFLYRAAKTLDWEKLGISIGDGIEGIRKSFSFTSVGKTAAATLNGLMTSLHKIILKTDFKGWAKDLTNGLNTFIKNTDWAELGTTLGDSFSGVIDFIYTAIDNFDVVKAARALYTTLNNFITHVNWNELGQAISKGAVKALNFIAETLEGIDWDKAGEGVADFLNGIDFTGILKGVLRILKAIIKALPTLIKSVITNLDFETAVGIVGTAFGLHFLKKLLAYFTTGASSMFTSIGSALSDKLSGAVSGIGNTIGGKICAGVGAFISGWQIGTLIREKWGKQIDEALEPLWDHSIGLFVDQGTSDDEIQKIADAVIERNKNERDYGAVYRKLSWAERFMYDPSMLDSSGQYLLTNPEEVAANKAKKQAENTVKNLNSIYNAVKEKTTAITTMIGEMFKGVTNNKNKGVEFLKTFQEGIDSKKQDVYNGVKNVANKVLSFFGIAADDAEKEGAELSENVASGIKSKSSDVNNAASLITDSINKRFDWMANSAAQSAVDTMNNLANGMSKDKSKSDSAADSVTTGITNRLRSIVDAATSSANGMMNSLTSNLTKNKSASDNAINLVISGITAPLAALAGAATVDASSLMTNLSTGITNNKHNTDWAASHVAEGIKSPFTGTSGIVGAASTWGSDILNNIAFGIASSTALVVGACSSVAGSIKSYLGFSEPEKGPLSDFHTYMPDMMQLMAKGIKENEDTPLKAVSELAGKIADEAEGIDVLVPIRGKASYSFIDNFADKIVNGFTTLIERLEAIADRVQFRVPAFATGTVLPYSASGSGAGDTPFAPDYSAITQRMDELSKKLDRIEDAIDSKETGITDEAVYRSVKRSAKKESKSTGRNPFD